MPARPNRKKAPAPSGFTKAQVDAAVTARDRAAAGNPGVVRGAFLGGQPIRLGEFEIKPLTIGTFWLLEEIGSPLAGQAGTSSQVITLPLLAEAALVLIEGERAAELWKEGKEAFAAAARKLAWQIPIADLNNLTQALVSRVTEAHETMPPPDAAAGTNPSEPPAKTQA